MTDREAERLQRLIQRRRKALGITPNRWRVLFSRLSTFVWRIL